MAKRRIKNNFSKWLMKSIPFFLIVFFVFFNISFFFYNSASYIKKLDETENGPVKRFSRDSEFNYVLRAGEKEDLTELIEIYRMQKDEYPNFLQEIGPNIKSTNWIYTKQSDRYILEYKN